MNKSSSLLLHLHLHLHLIHFLKMNKTLYLKKKNSKFSIPWKKFKISKFFKKKKKSSIKNFNSMKKFKISKIFKKKKKKEGNFSKKALGLGALRSYFLGCFQKKIINQNFQFLEKIQDFQIFQKKKKSKFSIPSKNSSFQNSKLKKKKKIFIKFFFRNKKLWPSSRFFSDATSSQLSTLSIHRSMKYVSN